MIPIPRKQFDVVIAGAGPAGSSAAIRLARAGFSVVLVEQKKFPRAKLCGEFISPECIEHLEELGVMPTIHDAGAAELSKTVFHSRNERCVSIDSEWFGNSRLPALSLSRAEMDLCLLQRARETGVVVLEETAVTRLLFDGESVVGVAIKDKSGNVEPVTARITIDATGRLSFLARHVKNGSEKARRAPMVAFKTHIRGAQTAEGSCEIYSFRRGYGGCNQVENGLHNLCFIASAKDVKNLGSDPDKVVRELVFTNRRATKVLREARSVAPWLAVPIEHSGRAKPTPAEGLMTIGDATAFIDPFTGSGILMALESSKLGAGAIERHLRGNTSWGELEIDYEEKYAAAFDSRLRLSSLLRNCAYVPFFAESMIAALSLSSALRRRVARATRT